MIITSAKKWKIEHIMEIQEWIKELVAMYERKPAPFIEEMIDKNLLFMEELQEELKALR